MGWGALGLKGQGEGDPRMDQRENEGEDGKIDGIEQRDRRKGTGRMREKMGREEIRKRRRERVRKRKEGRNKKK